MHTFELQQMKSLIRSQCVCKEWRSIIHDDPDFKPSFFGQRKVVVVSRELRTRNLIVKPLAADDFRPEKQFKFGGHVPFLNKVDNLPAYCRFPLVPDGGWPRVWCSCNGLVLFNVKTHILLWNPSTGRSTKVLELGCLVEFGYRFVSGLCYDSSNGDYKAVLIFTHVCAKYGFEDGRFVIVASLRNKEWRHVPFPYNIDSVRDGVNFHNTLHWIVNNSYFEELGYSMEWNKIIYFDPGHDEFRELPTPVEENSIIGLGIIDDCLCMARESKETRAVEVLVMKEYRRKESWITKFVIPTYALRNIGIGYVNITLYSPKNNSKVLLWSNDYGEWKLCIYDLEKKKLKKTLKESGVYGNRIGVLSHVESFTSSDEFIWRDDQHKHFASVQYQMDDGQD